MGYMYDVKAIMGEAHQYAHTMAKWNASYAIALQHGMKNAWFAAKKAMQVAKQTEQRTQVLSSDVVSYRGRNYKMLWNGNTKYGVRAKLAFIDGGKEFWVDVRDVREAIQVVEKRVQSARCMECGRHAVTTKRDSNGIVGHVCARCAKVPSNELSFA